MVKTTYLLTRTGNGRALDHPHATLARALQSVGQSLYDNGYATKEEAQRFAATVKPDGIPTTFYPYIFTLTIKKG